MKIRNCAWAGDEQVVKSERVVWARAGVVAFNCPKSIISPNSVYFLEHFKNWKVFGGGTLLFLEAKVADAVLVLEQAWQKENHRG